MASAACFLNMSDCRSIASLSSFLRCSCSCTCLSSVWRTSIFFWCSLCNLSLYCASAFFFASFWILTILASSSASIAALLAPRISPYFSLAFIFSLRIRRSSSLLASASSSAFCALRLNSRSSLCCTCRSLSFSARFRSFSSFHLRILSASSFFFCCSRSYSFCCSRCRRRVSSASSSRLAFSAFSCRVLVCSISSSLSFLILSNMTCWSFFFWSIAAT
mmetsp:Transcript_16272/g.41152  ORF Transcript_16272/g.41152 Transcript_16272/m.41152 type:complete len:219 (-) Transcript_16272:459-1115(-)